jgi:hypothetical protein
MPERSLRQLELCLLGPKSEGLRRDLHRRQVQQQFLRRLRQGLSSVRAALRQRDLQVRYTTLRGLVCWWHQRARRSIFGGGWSPAVGRHTCKWRYDGKRFAAAAAHQWNRRLGQPLLGLL